MAKKSEKELKQTRILLFDKDRLKLKEIAETERRRMIDMMSIILEYWEKNHE